jgi:hypothetical protein
MNARKYGLFHKVGRRWIRLFPKLAFYKASAVRLFQNHLLHLSLNMGKTPALRPVKD